MRTALSLAWKAIRNTRVRVVDTATPHRKLAGYTLRRSLQSLVVDKVCNNVHQKASGVREAMPKPHLQFRLVRHHDGVFRKLTSEGDPRLQSSITSDLPEVEQSRQISRSVS